MIGGANGVAVNITGGSITANGNTVRAIAAFASGTGGVSITTNAAHTISVLNTFSGGTHYGIEAANNGTAGDVSVTSRSIGGTGPGNLWGIGATNAANGGNMWSPTTARSRRSVGAPAST